MAQHDYTIANQSGAAFRSDLNNGLAAIVSQNSGAAQPSTTYAYQWWADTATGLLKIRNAANNAWITVGTLASTNLGLLALDGGTVMLFQQTSAPTGWTKLTTHNNKALRVVSGTASTGGSTAFTSVFASRTPTGSVSGTNTSGSVNSTTLTIANMPSHSHSYNTSGAGSPGLVAASSSATPVSSSSTGGGGSHNHGFTQPSWSGSFSGAVMDFAVAYVDVIFASKD